ncbi:hypothetical protein E4U59_006519, partial [Claviceps monticola]
MTTHTMMIKSVVLIGIVVETVDDFLRLDRDVFCNLPDRDPGLARCILRRAHRPLLWPLAPQHVRGSHQGALDDAADNGPHESSTVWIVERPISTRREMSSPEAPVRRQARSPKDSSSDFAPSTSTFQLEHTVYHNVTCDVARRTLQRKNSG